MNSDFYIQASNYEGLPHSILEAMSFGIPVLSTPVGECLEILGENERGYLLDLPVSIDNIKSKITEIINEKNIAITKGEKGKDFIYKNYNFLNTFNLYKNLFFLVSKNAFPLIDQEKKVLLENFEFVKKNYKPKLLGIKNIGIMCSPRRMSNNWELSIKK